MGKIRRANAHGINVLAHLIEHLAEILKARRIWNQLQRFLRMRRAHVRVAQRDEINHAGLVKRGDVLATAIADADAREVDFIRRRRAEHQSRREHRNRARRQNTFEE